MTFDDKGSTGPVHCISENGDRTFCGMLRYIKGNLLPKSYRWVSIDTWLSEDELPNDACQDCASAVSKYLVAKAEEQSLIDLSSGGKLSKTQSKRFLDHAIGLVQKEEFAFQHYLKSIRERLVALSGGKPDETIRHVLDASEKPGSDVTLALYAAFLVQVVKASEVKKV